tara:strand:- start:2130 stop:2492 length:363 start_codon:yes stop_codon:yes gene_type:complete
MKNKRSAKLGYVYILKSTLRDGFYKYGCTTTTPKKRCSRINSTDIKGYGFTVLSSFLTKDCFHVENNMKWDLLPMNFGVFGELFHIDFDSDFESISSEKDLVNRFLIIGNIIEGDICLRS